MAESSRRVVIFPSACVHFVSGDCTITALKGRVSLNGYRLNIGEAISFFAPTWLPAGHLHITNGSGSKAGASKASRQGKELSLKLTKLKGEGVSCPTDASISTSVSVLLIEGRDPHKQHWMVAAEWLYHKFSSHLALEATEATNDTVFVGSAIVGPKALFTRLEIETMRIPQAWEVLANQLVERALEKVCLLACLPACVLLSVDAIVCKRYTCHTKLGLFKCTLSL